MGKERLTWWGIAFRNLGWTESISEELARELTEQAKKEGREDINISIQEDSICCSVDEEKGLLEANIKAKANFKLPQIFQGEIIYRRYYSGPRSTGNQDIGEFVISQKKEKQKRGKWNCFSIVMQIAPNRTFNYERDYYPEEGRDYFADDPEEIIKRICEIFGKAVIIMGVTPQTPQPTIKIE